MEQPFIAWVGLEVKGNTLQNTRTDVSWLSSTQCTFLSLTLRSAGGGEGTREAASAAR